MPKMGESITEGTVLTWYKKPGESIEVDETLLEIGTDKVDTEVPSTAAGVLDQILVEEGATVEVGTVIAVIESDAAAVSSEAVSQSETQVAEPEPEVSERAETSVEEPALEPVVASAPASSSLVAVVMPKMGESITEGTVLTWHKQPGDVVELDETLLEIGTDKVDTEVPSPVAGILHETLVPEGETVEVGTEIARISTSTEPISAQPATNPAPEPAMTESASGDGAMPPKAVTVADTASEASIPRRGTEGQFFSPLVRAIAEKEGVSLQELEQLTGTGREGRITKEDLMGYLARRSSPQTPAIATPSAPPRPRTPVSAPKGYDGRVEIIEMDRMRQIIAEHMVRSKATSAHVTSFAEADVTNLARLREANKEAFLKREGIKLSFTPFLVECAVEALRSHPVMNSSVDGTSIIVKKDYHIGIAVAIDTERLVVPVIRDAGSRNLTGLAHEANNLAERARNKKLQPDDLQGGTFTVTNIGSIGSIMGTPIINQPQVAILATGAIKKRPVVIEDPKLGDIIAIRHIMYISLSYDHRVIDGAMAASFLRQYVQLVESYDPGSMV